MKIDALMSLTSLQKLFDDSLTSWEWDGFLTYILLNEKTDANALEAKLPAVVEEQAGEQENRCEYGVSLGKPYGHSSRF